jgi:hypothetical protein
MINGKMVKVDKAAECSTPEEMVAPIVGVEQAVLV